MRIMLFLSCFLLPVSVLAHGIDQPIDLGAREFGLSGILRLAVIVILAFLMSITAYHDCRRKTSTSSINQKQNKLQITLWIVAALAIFIFLSIVGWRVFYGIVVPQVNNLETFSTIGLFVFAALAGLAVNLGPCSLAVLPAYMSFFLGMNGHDEKTPLKKSVKLGAIASSGVVAFYLVLGFLFATIGPTLAAYAPQLKLIIALIILVLGIMLLKGWSIELHAVSKCKDGVARQQRESQSQQV